LIPVEDKLVIPTLS